MWHMYSKYRSWDMMIKPLTSMVQVTYRVIHLADGQVEGQADGAEAVSVVTGFPTVAQAATPPETQVLVVFNSNINLSLLLKPFYIKEVVVLVGACVHVFIGCDLSVWESGGRDIWDSILLSCHHVWHNRQHHGYQSPHSWFTTISTNLCR